MGPIQHIRKKILNVSQAELAEIAKVNQATVSRWENGILEPSREELSLIRAEVASRNLPWNDGLFFETGNAA